MQVFKTLSLILLTTFLLACQGPDQVEIEVSELTISKIHQAYQNGDYTSEQLVGAYLERISKMDSSINAITFINPEALEIAKNLDREFRETKILRPLHGIPLIVKDNINTKGLPTTAGSLALKDFYPKENTFIIQQLIQAGAIVIAKSNMAEWAFSPMHSHSSTAGITSNPYNLDHVPAGSSGGTGAAIAANFGAIGLGTDTGNSIRGPSSHNALVGFRTTLGLISREGIVPLYLRNDVVGPMCRTVEDAVKVMEVMAAFDPQDPITGHAQGKIPENYTQFLDKEGMKGARIGVFRTLSENNPHPEIKNLFEQAILDMQNMGATIIDSVLVQDFDSLRQDQWCATFKEDLETFLAEYGNPKTPKTLEEVIAIGTASDFAKIRLETFLINSGRWGSPEIGCGDAYTDEKRIAFREAIEKAMDELNLDALIYPSWNNPPATIANFQEEYKGDNSQVIAPHTGQPAFTVPMGFTSGNLPAGIQFLGKMFAEPTLIRLAFAYEQGTMHRKPPF